MSLGISNDFYFQKINKCAKNDDNIYASEFHCIIYKFSATHSFYELVYDQLLFNFYSCTI